MGWSGEPCSAGWVNRHVSPGLSPSLHQGHLQEVQAKPTSHQQGVLLPSGKYSFTAREAELGTSSELVLHKQKQLFLSQTTLLGSPKPRGDFERFRGVQAVMGLGKL